MLLESMTRGTEEIPQKMCPLTFWCFRLVLHKVTLDFLTLVAEQLYVTCHPCVLERCQHFDTLRTAFTHKQLHLDGSSFLLLSAYRKHHKTSNL